LSLRYFRSRRVITGSTCSGRICSEGNLSSLFLSHRVSSYKFIFFGFLCLDYFLMLLQTLFEILHNYIASHIENLRRGFSTLCKAWVWHTICFDILFDIVWFILYVSNGILYLHHIVLNFIFSATFHSTCKQQILTILITLNIFKLQLLLLCTFDFPLSLSYQRNYWLKVLGHDAIFNLTLFLIKILSLIDNGGASPWSSWGIWLIFFNFAEKEAWHVSTTFSVDSRRFWRRSI
jgi:hypothetical protein